MKFSINLVLTVCCIGISHSAQYKPLSIGALLPGPIDQEVFQYLRAALDLAKIELDYLMNEFGFSIQYKLEDTKCDKKHQ